MATRKVAPTKFPTKEDVYAGTRVQIWQELMRQPRYPEALQLDPEAAAEAAVRIFNKLVG